MQPLKLLFALLLSTASVRGFWWSTTQSSDPPVSKQVQYVRAFTYQPVAFPAHSLLAPPSPYKFIQATPAAIVPTAKQVGPVQPASQPLPQVASPSTSPFSSFFGSAFGGVGQALSQRDAMSIGGSVSPVYQQQQQQQHQQHQQQQQQQQQHQQMQQQQVVQQAPQQLPPSLVPSQSDGPMLNQGAGPAGTGGFYGQQHPSKYPYFTMDQVQYLSSLPSTAAHTPQVQFVPCMCPIAVNVQSHAEVADKRLDETTTADSEVVVGPSVESEK